MAYSLNDLKYRDSQVITDDKGNVVDLGNLDRNMSEMVHEPTGERVTNPKLQPYMDNPKLAEAEAAIEFMKYAEDPDVNDEGDATPRKAITDETRAAIGKKTEEAKQTIEGYNSGVPPRPAGDFVIPGEGERERFERFLIDNKFGGQDPLLFDPATAVLNLGEDHYAKLYEKMYQPGMPPAWGLLDEKQKAAFVKNTRSMEFERLKRDNEVKKQMRNEALGQYDAERKKREAAYKEAQTRVEASIKEQRELKAKVEEQQKKEKKEYLDLRKDLVEQQSKLAELSSTKDKDGYKREPDAEQIKQQKEIMQALEDRIAELRDKLYEKTPNPSKGMPITEELVRKYIAEAKGNKDLARMNAIRDGYNPNKLDHAHRPDKKR